MSILLNTILATLLAAAAEPRHFIFDHDGAPDDYTGMAILLATPNLNIDLVTFCPADSYREPAIDTSLGMLELYGKTAVTVAAGPNAGVNLFPKEWRGRSVEIAALTTFLEAAKRRGRAGFTATPAPRELVRRLSGSTKYEVLATGPLSNIAEAIRIRPAIVRNIERITFMGGALDVLGNVARGDRRPVAEWNVFNNPAAVNTVLKSGVPVRFVPLDATNKAPITMDFMNRLDAQKTFELSRLFNGAWIRFAAQFDNPDPQLRYYFWDPLAAAIAVKPELATFKRERVSVVTKRGPDEGRLIRDPRGWWAEVAVDANAGALDTLVLESLRH